MTADTRPLAGPAIGSAWQPARPGQPRPLDSGMSVFGDTAHLPVLGTQVYSLIPEFLPRDEREHGRDGRTARLGTRHQRGAVLR